MIGGYGKYLQSRLVPFLFASAFIYISPARERGHEREQ